MNLNVDVWKEFRLTDIFIVKGGFYNKKPEHSVEGGIPFLASTETNNGVTEHYSIEDIRAWNKVGNIDNTLDKKIYKGNCIAVTVNGSVCNAFYQSEDFTCSHDITALYPIDHELTPLQALFICTVIMKEKYRWSYGRKPHDVKKFGKSIIKLPVNEKKTVDWMFMEQYIKSLNHKPIATANRGYGFHTLGVETWKDFCLGDYFEIKKGKRLTSDEQTEGSTPYIGAIDSNNGIANYIGQDAIHEGNTISLSYNGSVGEAFYQPRPFWATDDVNVLYFREENGVAFNKYIALFVCADLRQEKYRYSYGRKWILDSMKSTVIKLPEKSGKPDWTYMEDYIKSLPYGDRI